MSIRGQSRPKAVNIGTPINQTLVNDLAGGGFIAQQRNVVLVGGTTTGKTHLRDLTASRKIHRRLR